ncbi:MAG TPA: hypothetical protein VFH66_00755 [Mycobacteriales bacterium]|nr:hypothetical protein [Mycobacteriales bacterium]
MTQPSNGDARTAFAELGELAVSAVPLVEILQRTVDLAKAVIGSQSPATKRRRRRRPQISP